MGKSADLCAGALSHCGAARAPHQMIKGKRVKFPGSCLRAAREALVRILQRAVACPRQKSKQPRSFAAGMEIAVAFQDSAPEYGGCYRGIFTMHVSVGG
jgi:hypothetical protein